MTTADDAWMGVDLGTQSVRTLVVSRSGEVLGTGSAVLHSSRHDGTHEQDPEQWWSAFASACQQSLRGVQPEAVRGLAVDATSGTVLLADGAGRPLTPALMYDDVRAAGEVARVNEIGEPVWSALGYRRMQPTWALPKLLWLLRHYPDVAGSARLQHQSDVVNRRLAGYDVPTDLSSALKTGAHLIDEVWPAEVLEELGVPASLLPSLVRSGTPIGTVCAAAAAETGLAVGTPIVAGATDGCAAQIGAGALEVGSWNSVLGTTLVLKGVTRDLLLDPNGVVYSHKAPNGLWLPGGASSTGAGLISREFASGDLARLTVGAADHEPSPVLTYPLVSEGERFPFVAPDARSFTVGAPADEVERFASILQGVAHIERLCFDYLHLLGAPVDGRLVLTGGATRSDYWCQLRADVLRRPVTLPDNAEPALGMAILAASSGEQPPDVAADMVRTRVTLEPRPGTAGRYDEAYLQLVSELERRGWLSTTVATHARERTGR